MHTHIPHLCFWSPASLITEEEGKDHRSHRETEPDDEIRPGGSGARIFAVEIPLAARRGIAGGLLCCAMQPQNSSETPGMHPRVRKTGSYQRTTSRPLFWKSLTLKIPLPVQTQMPLGRNSFHQRIIFHDDDLGDKASKNSEYTS